MRQKNALSWYQKSGIWNFMEWGCTHVHDQCCPSVAALSLKCAATLSCSETGFVELAHSKILDSILSSIVELSSKSPPDNCCNGASNGFTANGTAGITSQSKPAINGVNHGTTRSLDSVNGHTSIINGASSCTDLSKVNSSILHALLTLILAMLDHKPGREWVEHHEVGKGVLLPCLSYSSVFVQRTAALGLTRLLRSSQQQCERLFPLLTGASEGSTVPVKPSVLISLMTLLLDDLPLGQCPDWLSVALVSLNETLRAQMTSLSATTSSLCALFEIRLRLLALQHTSQLLRAGSEGAVAASATTLMLRDLSDLLIKDGKLVSPSGWARAASLASAWSAALAGAGTLAGAGDAVGRLAVHLLMLPVSGVLRADEAARRDAVMALLRSCATPGHSEGSLPALQVWLEERAVDCRYMGAAGACLRAAATAVPSFSTQLCEELLLAADWKALLAVDLSCTPHTTCADEPTVLAALLLLQALIRRRVELAPVTEVISALSAVYSSSHNTKQRAVAVLECVLLYLTTPDGSVSGLPQVTAVKSMVEEGLCHTAWEVRDSALQVLTAALQYEEYCPALYTGCVQRSTEALLDCEESFVQVAAAALLAGARTRALPGWDWNCGHAWCVRVCCSCDAVAGCESDGVAAAAWTLLLALHAGQRCDYSASEEQSHKCVLTALHHAQNCCTADSDTLRLAALQYVTGHIENVLQMPESSMAQGSTIAVDRCCEDGSVWCVIQCAKDPAARVKEAAVQVCRQLLRAVTPHSAQGSPSVRPGLTQTNSATRVGPAHPPDVIENLGGTRTTSTNAAAKVEVQFRSYVDNNCETVISKPISHLRKSESIQKTLQSMQGTLEQYTSEAKKFRTDPDIGGSTDHLAESMSSQSVHSVDSLPPYEADSKRASSDVQQTTGSSGCARDSNEANVILEEVLDFPDLHTLDELRRSELTSPLLTDRKQTPAVLLQNFIAFSNANLTETKSDDVQDRRELIELLEDIQLQVKRQKEDVTEDLSLAFGEPTHLTMDCY